MQQLDPQIWKQRAVDHKNRIQPVLDKRNQRHSQFGTDPILDFLFEYYAFRPGKLLRWSPGMGIALLGSDALDFTKQKGFVDIGVGSNGLVYFANIPGAQHGRGDEVLSVGQRVRVQVLEVNLKRQRIGLSMKGVQQP